MTIIWCVGSETEHNRQIFCHFRPFFALLPPMDLENQNFEKMEKKKNAWRYSHFTNAYDKGKSYDVWFLRCGARQRYFFGMLDHFLPFYTTNNPVNQNLMYGSWDIGVQQNFFVISDHFMLLPPTPTLPPNSLKNQNFEKMKETSWDINILHMFTINNDHIMYGSWYMHDRQKDKQADRKSDIEVGAPPKKIKVIFHTGVFLNSLKMLFLKGIA